VENIKEEKHIFTWICVQNATKKYYFSKFVGKHYYEASNLMLYLWKNPPSYLNIPKEPIKIAIESPKPKDFDWGIEEVTEKNPFSNYNGNNGNISNNTSSYSKPDTQSAPNNGNSQMQIRTQVNTAAVKEALADLVSVEQMGIDTLVELENQARTIDNIENKLEDIHAHMDRTEKLLRGIESLPAYIGNSLNKKKGKNQA